MNTIKHGKLALAAIIAAGMLCFLLIARNTGSVVSAESMTQDFSSDNIQVVPVQITRDSYGIAMVDKSGQSIWIYEIDNKSAAHSRLKLLAARSFRYDRLLQQYNTADPKPQQVKSLLESLDKLQSNKPDQKKQPADQNSMIDVAEPNLPNDNN